MTTLTQPAQRAAIIVLKHIEAGLHEGNETLHVADLIDAEYAPLLAAVDEAIEAMADVLCHTVDARTYPDSPCIDREYREALRDALAKLRALAATHATATGKE